MEGRILDFIKMSNQAQPQGIATQSVAPVKQEITEDLLKTVAKRAPRTSGVIGYIPYVGDVADIGLGAYNMTHGHPFIGAGQIGLGGVGLATGGLGSKVIKGLATAGLKKAQRDIVARGMRKIANNPYRYQVAPSVGLEALALIDDSIKKGKQKNKKEDIVDEKKGTPFTILSDEEIGADLTPIPKIKTPLPKVIDQPLTGYVASQSNMQQQQPVQQNNYDPTIAEALIRAYGQQYDDINRQSAFNRFIDNLGMIGSRQMDRFDNEYYTYLGSALGMDNLANIPGKIGSEQAMQKQASANRMANVQDRMNKLGAINTLAGNLAVAKQMGMDPAVALADKDIQKVLTAFNTSSGRENVANINAQARLLDSYLDNETQRAIAQGKIDVALKIQQLKNNASTRNALINASSFGATPEDIQAMLTQYGYAPTGLTSQGTLEGQQTNVNPVVVGSYLDRMNRR